MKTRNAWLTLVVLLAVHGSARSDFIATATLTGDGESPSTGTGHGTVTFNSATDTLTVVLTFSGLTSPTAIPPGVPGAAHIHFGLPGVEGPILFPFLDFPTGETIGFVFDDPDGSQPHSRPPGRHQHVRRGGERDRGRTDLFQHSSIPLSSPSSLYRTNRFPSSPTSQPSNTHTNPSQNNSSNSSTHSTNSTLPSPTNNQPTSQNYSHASHTTNINITPRNHRRRHPPRHASPHTTICTTSAVPGHPRLITRSRAHSITHFL